MKDNVQILRATKEFLHTCPPMKMEQTVFWNSGT